MNSLTKRVSWSFFRKSRDNEDLILKNCNDMLEHIVGWFIMLVKWLKSLNYVIEQKGKNGKSWCLELFAWLNGLSFVWIEQKVIIYYYSAC